MATPTQTKRPVDILNMDAQTLYITQALAAAGRCTARLSREGFTVLGISIGARNPRVVIQRSGRCARLQGAMAMRICNEKGRKQIMVAEVERCEVVWAEEEH